jgi:hypothetical protein
VGPARRAAADDREMVSFADKISRAFVDSRGEWMPSLQVDPATTRPIRPELASRGSAGWRPPPMMSDDECLALLEKAIEDHDPESLDRVAWLIGRLAVPIE